jgi:hypothetical protein
MKNERALVYCELVNVESRFKLSSFGYSRALSNLALYSSDSSLFFRLADFSSSLSDLVRTDESGGLNTDDFSSSGQVSQQKSLFSVS